MNKTSRDTNFRRMMIYLLDDDCGISYKAWYELSHFAKDNNIPIIDIQRQIDMIENRVLLKCRKNRI